jgi:hypothetical protein
MLALVACLLLFAACDSPTAEDPSAAQLAKVRRIYVDILTGGDAALKIRDLLMSSLQNSKLFIITENDAKADAILKGSGDDKVFTDLFQSSEGLNAHTQIGVGLDGSTRTSRARGVGMTIGENESRRSEERKHEAMATVRLVTRDGDVIWSATAESLGGKFMGASADVADKIAKRLVTDYESAKKQVAH